GALLATSAAALAALLDPPALRGLPAAAAITAGAAVVAIAAVAPRLNGGAGVTVRLALAPVWAAGAAALVAGAIVCLPFAMLVGRAQPLLRMAARSVAAGLEVLRGPPLPA
ncbi:MAG TPA: hypothetical protein VML96_08710, partial [Egibacteraceae bacterium]|nr:hypothetical protein [Egibacteraceae bacterium]